MTITRVAVVEDILGANDRQARQNRARLDAASIFAINLLASPGAGKTSVILRTIAGLAPRLRLGVVEGDTAPVTIDADKVIAAGRPAVQVNTGGNCHLDAGMVAGALPQLPLADLDVLIVENVGNLVCTAAFQLGTHANVLVSSVPEGDDKPYKYPAIFSGIDALILNKIDLQPYVEFDRDYFRRGVELLNPGVAFFPLSCRSGEGLVAWLDWLAARTIASRAE
jgi:hydrogenase nickel incorporation protein HypB